MKTVLLLLLHNLLRSMRLHESTTLYLRLSTIGASSRLIKHRCHSPSRHQRAGIRCALRTCLSFSMAKIKLTIFNPPSPISLKTPLASRSFNDRRAYIRRSEAEQRQYSTTARHEGSAQNKPRSQPPRQGPQRTFKANLRDAITRDR